MSSKRCRTQAHMVSGLWHLYSAINTETCTYDALPLHLQVSNKTGVNNTVWFLIWLGMVILLFSRIFLIYLYLLSPVKYSCSNKNTYKEEIYSLWYAAKCHWGCFSMWYPKIFCKTLAESWHHGIPSNSTVSVPRSLFLIFVSKDRLMLSSHPCASFL